MYYKNFTDDNLKKKAYSLFIVLGSMHDFNALNTRRSARYILEYNNVLTELEERGYTINVVSKLEIKKKETR